MDYEIPLIRVPSQRVAASVGGRVVRVTVAMHPRDGGWYADVESPAGVLVAAGRRLVSGRLVTGRGLLPFSIVCEPTGSDEDLGSDPWGREGTHRLVYRPA